MLERQFQARLIKKIKKLLPEAIVYNNNGNYIQGFPDITVYYKNRYAVLECKRSEHDPHQPNQDYYISKIGQMAFASFISPETETAVLDQMLLYLEDSE